MSEEIIFFDIRALRDQIVRREISPVQVVDVLLDRIERLNPRLNAYLSISEQAREEARKAEQAVVQRRELGLLHGIPFSIKDLLLTRELPTTAGSKIFGSGLTSEEDAAAVSLLKKAGGILIGKVHLHECAFGVTNENAHFGPARNPWDLERVTGGSSGGSAGSVAGGLAYASLGTDTRGSVRIPSACCGLTGLKPTLNLIPTFGLLPLSESLDHIGPMCRSVEDVAVVLQAVASGSKEGSDYIQASQAQPNRIKLGFAEYYFRDVDPEIEAAVRQTMALLEESGLAIREIEIPGIEEVLEASRVIAGVEALANHDFNLRSQPQSYDPAVRERLEQCRDISALQYLQARQKKAAITREFEGVFARVDCLIAPALPAFPPPIGQTYLEINGRREHVVQGFCRLNAAQNMAGIPALVLPCGFSRTGLPIGLQLIAASNREPILLSLGSHYQRLTGWHRRHARTR
ncbi:MAG: amidase [Acidobacteriota bacterium]